MTIQQSEMDATLFCVNCDKETTHRVYYQDEQINKITCSECKMAIQLNQKYIQEHIKEDFISRVLSKPGRMTREMEIDLSAFLRYLPYRIVTKPFRVYQEFNEEKED